MTSFSLIELKKNITDFCAAAIFLSGGGVRRGGISSRYATTSTTHDKLLHGVCACFERKISSKRCLLFLCVVRFVVYVGRGSFGKQSHRFPFVRSIVDWNNISL